MLSQKTVKEFIGELASDAPAPGGGSVAALCGALGAGLSAMVARLTIGREKYKDCWESMQEVLTKGDELTARLLELMEKDTEVFNQYMAARKLPKDTEEQKAVRKLAVDAAALKTAQVPLRTMELCLDMARIAATAAACGNPNAVTDAATAAMLARAAAAAAMYNVLINLPGIADQAFVEDTRKETARIMAEVEEIARGVDAAVMQSLSA